MTSRIILVDDDRNILTSVSLALEAEGFDVQSYHDSVEGLEAIKAQSPDLAILDVKMPKMDGMELLSKLRETHATPAIFLTSKDDEVDEVLGLRLGADDYITKPFSQRLLLERIRTVIRRAAMRAAPAQATQLSQQNHILQRGHLSLDDERHICAWKGTALNLTVTEYLLIKALAQNPGHVRNRDQLISLAYGESIYVDDRTIDTHIKRIRKKFKDIDDHFNHIETLYGIGYKYKEEL